MNFHVRVVTLIFNKHTPEFSKYSLQTMLHALSTLYSILPYIKGVFV